MQNYYIIEDLIKTNIYSLFDYSHYLYYYNENNYKSLLIYFIILIIFGFIFIAISYMLKIAQTNTEKTSTYECGFSPFDDAKNTFDIKFYVVALLYLLFDLEIIYLFPWVLTLKYLTLKSLITILFFIFILLLGFIYEWVFGGLDWA